jgi:hypothetical protein
MRKMTNEEKVAQKLATVVSDISLDLDMVGRYLLDLSHSSQLRRLNEIIETANYEKEENNGGEYSNHLQ